MDDQPTLELVFHLSLSLKVCHHFTTVPSLHVDRNESESLNDVYKHLQMELGLHCGEEYSLLPIAVCHTSASSSSVELSQPPLEEDVSCQRIPLVAEQIWKKLLRSYCRPVVKVVVESRKPIDISPPHCNSIPTLMKSRQLKCLDARHYIPSKLKRSNMVKICEKIVWEDYSIKPKLRRGLWMHLLGVFHPGMETQAQRANFIEKLRRIYYHLKDKLGDRHQWSPEVRQLYQSIRCDAVRTDPGEKFLAEDTEKLGILEQVTLIYALEHKEVKYTQGMTDLLSPILYVMQREDDAYICLSALFGRIKENFDEWCKGTLNRMERLRHLCEVLDPELFCYLTSDLMDDPFVLFFGMILVQCRREFTFAESLHLFEVLCAASFFREPDVSGVSDSDWAQFMTSESPEMIEQVFGGDTSPYSVRPLGSSFTCNVIPSAEVHTRSPPFVSPQAASTGAVGLRAGFSPLMEERTVSLASHSRSSFSAPCRTMVLDNDRENRVQTPEPANGNISQHPTEMSDMSSISSSTTTTNGNGPLVHPNRQILQRKTVSLPNPDTKSSSQDSAIGASPTKELALQEASLHRMETDSKETIMPTAEGIAVYSSSMEETVKATAEGNAVLSSSPEEMFLLENGVHPNHIILGKADSKLEGTGGRRRNSTNWKDEGSGSPKVAFKTQHSQPASSFRSPSLPLHTSKYGVHSDHAVASHGDSRLLVGETDEPERNSCDRNDEVPLSPAIACRTQHLRSAPSLPSASTSPLQRASGHPCDTCDPFQSSVHLPCRNGPFLSLPSLDVARSSHPNYPFPIALSPGRNSPLPFEGVMHQLSGSRQHSLEASIEVSQVLSQAFIPDLATHESSLSVHMADAFSLFVCLAILISKRKAILRNRLDFVNLSMLLNAREDGHNLGHILPLARSLCKIYSELQRIYFGDSTSLPRERWLDADTSDASENHLPETPIVYIPPVHQPPSSSSDLSSSA